MEDDPMALSWSPTSELLGDPHSYSLTAGECAEMEEKLGNRRVCPPTVLLRWTTVLCLVP